MLLYFIAWTSPSFKTHATGVLYYCLWLRVYTHIYITDIVKIVHEDYTVLTPKQLGEPSLLFLAAWHMLLTFVGIVIPAKYKVTESMM